MFGTVWRGTPQKLTIYIAPLAAAGKPDTSWRKVCDVEDEVTEGAVHGDDFFLLSHKDGPRFKIVRTSLANPDFATAQTVVPEGKMVLRDLASAKDALYVEELDGGIGRLLRVPFVGTRVPEQVKLPFDGSVHLAAFDLRVPGTLLELTSWTSARQLYAFDPATKQVANTGLQPFGPYDNPQDLQETEVKVKSADGTMVPLSIVHTSGLKLNGSNPTILIVYGAYGYTIDPTFDRRGACVV
jgi:prolyl oligopeptidase